MIETIPSGNNYTLLVIDNANLKLGIKFQHHVNNLEHYKYVCYLGEGTIDEEWYSDKVEVKIILEGKLKIL